MPPGGTAVPGDPRGAERGDRAPTLTHSLLQAWPYLLSQQKGQPGVCHPGWEADGKCRQGTQSLIGAVTLRPNLDAPQWDPPPPAAATRQCRPVAPGPSLGSRRPGPSSPGKEGGGRASLRPPHGGEVPVSRALLSWVQVSLLCAFPGPRHHSPHLRQLPTPPTRPRSGPGAGVQRAGWALRSGSHGAGTTVGGRGPFGGSWEPLPGSGKVGREGGRAGRCWSGPLGSVSAKGPFLRGARPGAPSLPQGSPGRPSIASEEAVAPGSGGGSQPPATGQPGWVTSSPAQPQPQPDLDCPRAGPSAPQGLGQAAQKEQPGVGGQVQGGGPSAQQCPAGGAGGRSPEGGGFGAQ